MQHRVTKVKFGRDTNQRKALIRSLLRELILHEYLVTSLEKAKWLKKEIDKLITAAKKRSLHGEKLAKVILNDQEAVLKLISLLPRLKSRNSGYTRIYKLGGREGDNSNLGKIELIFDEVIAVGARRDAPVSEKIPELVKKKPTIKKTKKTKTIKE